MREGVRFVAKGGGPMKLVWLIGGFLLFMGLMSLLSSIGGGAAAGLGFGLMFCSGPVWCWSFLAGRASCFRADTPGGQRREFPNPPPGAGNHAAKTAAGEHPDGASRPKTCCPGSPAPTLHPHCDQADRPRPFANLPLNLSRIRQNIASGRSVIAAASKASSRAVAAARSPI